MPITSTPKIWMNGELVDWDKAQVHVLTHTLHYGTGVFEGIRAYETADGPAVFRLTEHIERLFSSAQIMGMEIPYTVDELVAATKETVASTGLDSCYIRPIAYFGYGEMGLNTLPCTVDVVDRLLAVGCLPRRRRRREGRADEDLVVDAPRSQHDAARVEDHRQLRQLVARQGRGAQGRLRRGDHARAERADRRVHRREHLRGPPRQAAHPAAVGRGARRHHAELGGDDRGRPRLRGRRRQPRPQ